MWKIPNETNNMSLSERLETEPDFGENNFSLRSAELKYLHKRSKHFNFCQKDKEKGVTNIEPK